MALANNQKDKNIIVSCGSQKLGPNGGGSRFRIEISLPLRLPLEIKNHDGSHLLKKEKNDTLWRGPQTELYSKSFKKLPAENFQLGT